MAIKNSINTSISANEILVGTGSNGYSGISPSSTAGYVLSSNGSSSNPSYIAPTTDGGLTLISSQTVTSGSEVVFNNLYNGYSTYFLNFTGIIPSNLGLTYIALNASSDNGSTYNTTTNYVGINTTTISFTTITNYTTTAYAPLTNRISNTPFVANGFVYLYNMGQNLPLCLNGQSTFFYSGLGDYGTGNIGGQIDQNNVDCIKISLTLGTFTSGVINLYGVVPL